LFVGNDAGPLHMASAVGLTTVAVFGASDAERYAPLGAQHRVLCRILPCSPVYQPGRPDRCRACMYPEPRCLLGVEVGEVEAAVLAALEASARRAALAGKEDWR
jgi:ADP-heptose:LPS heptosyltransferase